VSGVERAEQAAHEQRQENERRGIRHHIDERNRNRKVGPTTLGALLNELGLEIVKLDNLPVNIGKRAELVLCEHFDIYVADPVNRWASVPRRPEPIEDGMVTLKGDGMGSPMPETDMKGPQ
jgi:hypothetical protein